MKTTIISIVIILLFSSSAFSQPGRKFEKNEEIKKKQIEFIIKELQLTEKEKKAFVPIYNAYNNKREVLHMKKRKSMRNFRQNSLNMSNDDLIALSDQLVDTDVQIAQLGKTYNEKFKTVLPPLKVILLHKAEQEFKRHLIQTLKQRGAGQKNRP